MQNRVDLNKLKSLERTGHLMSQTHPDLPLTIWNYTNNCMFSDEWNETTLMCRGLVTDDKGVIVARPFKKFFNLEEAKHEATDEYQVFKKYDGSLIIIFMYQSSLIVASRGSFTSPQVKWASEILYENIEKCNRLSEEHTYVFELIHPENRIVVNYEDKKDLVLLGMINAATGNEVPLSKVNTQFTKAENLLDADYLKLKKLNTENEEGYVVLFSNGDRCKIKFEEYVRLHKIVTNTTSKMIWEHIKDEKPISELLRDVPDEFREWLYKVVGELAVKVTILAEGVENDWDGGVTKGLYTNLGSLTPGTSRRQVAAYFSECTHPRALFMKLDNKDFNPYLWKQVKPKHEKAFAI